MGENWTALSGGGNMKLFMPILQAPPTVFPRQNQENRGKSPKCTKNDQFRQIDFLNTALIHSNYTPIDAELHAKFFELICMFVALFVLELFTKNRSKNHRRNFADPMASKSADFP